MTNPQDTETQVCWAKLVNELPVHARLAQEDTLRKIFYSVRAYFTHI